MQKADKIVWKRLFYYWKKGNEDALYLEVLPDEIEVL